MAVVSLNNTNNNVTLSVTQADNFMSIYLNPDSSNKGLVKVYEIHQANMGVAFSTKMDIHNFLHQFKLLNPTITQVMLTVCLSNFGGPGVYTYGISGTGITLPAQTGNLAAWTSRMDTYIIRVF